MGVGEAGGVGVHAPLERDDRTASGYTVAHVFVFGFGVVRECAGEDGSPAEDFLHACVHVFEGGFVVEGWEAVGSDNCVEFFASYETPVSK